MKSSQPWPSGFSNGVNANRNGNANGEPMKSTGTLQRKIRLLPLCTAAVIWTCSLSCTTVKIVESNREVRFVPKGQSVTATTDSVLMPESLYRRYRQVVADEIERLER